jgi:hypothetical protein
MKINNVSYGSLKIPREEGVGVLHHFQHNFSYWQSVLLVEETGVPVENHQAAESH